VAGVQAWRHPQNYADFGALVVVEHLIQVAGHVLRFRLSRVNIPRHPLVRVDGELGS